MGCINWAWKIQGLRSNEKVLLAAIADRADKETGVCVSPISRLSRDCGGWTRQQTNRVAKRLQDYTLIRIALRYPGTDDPSRMFICNLLEIDADLWRPPSGKGQHRSRTAIMSTSAFQELLSAAMKGDRAYEDWASNLSIVEVKRDRLVCKVPDAEFAQKIYEYRDLIVSLAQEHISPRVKKLRFFWDRRKKIS